MLIHGLAICGEYFYAPAEIQHDAPESLAVPVNEQGDFFDQYSLEVVQYRKRGKEIVLEDSRTITVKRIGKDLQFNLDNFRVKLSVVSDPISYAGEYEHDDFKYKMRVVDILPYGIDDLIFEETGYVIVGCDAHEHYKGLE